MPSVRRLFRKSFATSASENKENRPPAGSLLGLCILPSLASAEPSFPFRATRAPASFLRPDLSVLLWMRLFFSLSCLFLPGTVFPGARLSRQKTVCGYYDCHRQYHTQENPERTRNPLRYGGTDFPDRICTRRSAVLSFPRRGVFCPFLCHEREEGKCRNTHLCSQPSDQYAQDKQWYPYPPAYGAVFSHAILSFQSAFSFPHSPDDRHFAGNPALLFCFPGDMRRHFFPYSRVRL